MIKVGIGQFEGVDTLDSVRYVIQDARDQLGGLPPQAAIVLAGIDFDHEVMLAEIDREFPGIELIGCTTAGTFSSFYGFSEDSINLILFHSDTIEFKTGIAENLEKEPKSSARSAVKHARDKLTKSESLCLIFPDGYTSSTTRVIEQLNNELKPDCPIIGGSAGRHAITRIRPRQFFGTKIFEDAMPIMLFGGRINYSFSVCNSWKPIGNRSCISEVNGREINRIGDMKALDFYHHYLGKNTRPDFEFPLAIFEEPDSEQFYIRVPTAYDEVKGTVTLGAPASEGLTVQLSAATPSRIIKETHNSVETAIKNFEGAAPELAIVVSCNARKGILGTRVTEELETLKKFLPENLPIWGFYGFSEFSPLIKDSGCRLHHMTMVTLLIGTENAHPPTLLHSESFGLPTQTSTEGVLKNENLLLRKKLMRSEHYRQSLEKVKDSNTELLGKINLEIEEANRKIQSKNEELERLYAELEKEKAKSDKLLLNVLPDEVAEELKAKGSVEPVHFSSASVLFTDFKDFTRISGDMTPKELVTELDYYFSHFDQVMEKYDLEKLKTIGDSFMCAGGIPKATDTHATDIVNAAWDIIEFMKEVKEQKIRENKRYWELRVGIHTGPLMAGVVGQKKFAYDVWGDVVNVASRLESTGEAGKINVSREVMEKIKDDFICEHRGKIAAKNKGKIDMYFVVGKK